jgi:hypothetical protein
LNTGWVWQILFTVAGMYFAPRNEITMKKNTS